MSRKKSSRKTPKRTLRSSFVTKIISHSIVESTQSDALSLARQGEPEGCVVWADAQGEGRGRHDHLWESPAGLNLYLSIIFRPPFSIDRVHEIQFLAGVSMAQAIQKVCRQKIHLKWPNDLMTKNKKLGGILLNAASSGSKQVDYVVMGLGLNVNADKKDFSPKVRPLATSLKIMAEKEIDRGKVFQAFLVCLEKNHAVLMNKGFAPLAKAWTQWAKPFLGKTISIENPIFGHTDDENFSIKGLTKIKGQAMGLTPEGYLRFKLTSGARDNATREVAVVDGILLKR